jgi:hypothetical protein
MILWLNSVKIIPKIASYLSAENCEAKLGPVSLLGKGRERGAMVLP